MPDARSLVVNADDFGLSAGVNRGVLEAHEAGVVSSVSVLVNAPGWTDAVQRLRDLGSPLLPGLGIGLHLNLTTGRPISWGGGFVIPGPEENTPKIKYLPHLYSGILLQTNNTTDYIDHAS